MSSPPLLGTAEWSATREVALLLGLTGGNRYAAQQLWLRKERIKAEASQFASAGSQQASRQPAGCRAEPATARAQAVTRQKTGHAPPARRGRRVRVPRAFKRPAKTFGGGGGVVRTPTPITSGWLPLIGGSIFLRK